jgi:hypothetical protein
MVHTETKILYSSHTKVKILPISILNKSSPGSGDTGEIAEASPAIGLWEYGTGLRANHFEGSAVEGT